METYDELESFDQDFNPQKPEGGRRFRPGLDALSDGDYDFEIVAADLTRTPKSNDLILRLGLRVFGGPLAGKEVDHTYFFKRQVSVDILGSDLCTLGFDADKWSALHGRKFSDELPRAVPKLRGLRFNSRKVTKDGFPNLYINTRLGGPAAPARAPAGVTAPPGEDDIPF